MAEPGVRYPRCLDGLRACPPEDCGGPPGYANLLEILRDPKHEDYGEYAAWTAGQAPRNRPFDPERFDVAAVLFDDPYDRLRMAIGNG